MYRFMQVLAMVFMLGLATAAGAYQTELKDDYQIKISTITTVALTKQQVRDAVLSGGLAHGWALKSEAPGRLVLELEHRGKYRVEIAVSYDETQYSITYVSSDNLRYSETADGARMIDNAYYRWLSSLTKAASTALRNVRAAP
ncbi:hypothetical protein [Niveibacterium microcysteis]|uniref:Lipoprotein n=1 Tax=Niveibacterium microcysteis TaxID=2811415 RepID=A0ABX7M8N0_9RHOO|nr:hypothetical protein [Niveibacterium microcysteis]QSI75842.1 hypothetical protein JY500_15325 [Niveibacterium microcysteis]